MPLARDLSDLPTGRGSNGHGCPPDRNPRYIAVLVEQWAENNREAGPKPTANHTRLRHSDAGKCARALAFTAAQIPPSDPMDAAGVWATTLGTLIHEQWQAALVARHGDRVRCETKCQVEGLDASGHADAVIETDDTCGHCLGVRPHRVVYELKSTGGFSFKTKIGDRGAPEGPSEQHRRQVALNAYALDACEAVIGYVATEAVSKTVAAKKQLGEFDRFCAEWTLPREVFVPLAVSEAKRMNRVLDLVDVDTLAPCSIPDPVLPVNALVSDPARGVWVVYDEKMAVRDTGSFWACNYCSHQGNCVAVGRPALVPMGDAVARITSTRGAA